MKIFEKFFDKIFIQNFLLYKNIYYFNTFLYYIILSKNFLRYILEICVFCRIFFKYF